MPHNFTEKMRYITPTRYDRQLYYQLLHKMKQLGSCASQGEISQVQELSKFLEKQFHI